MESSVFAFEIIPAERNNAVATGLMKEMDGIPSERIVLFFAFIFSLVFHLLFFGLRLHL